MDCVIGRFPLACGWTKMCQTLRHKLWDLESLTDISQEFFALSLVQTQTG